MTRTISIGSQDFEKLRQKNYLYIDKTNFIREWWEQADEVTLITRPRRFGKTLALSMVGTFFSVRYREKGELFDGLSIWNSKKFRDLQGTYPVISLSLAHIKETSYEQARRKICQTLSDLYSEYNFLLHESILDEKEE